jgi:hypothetical protein
MKTVSPMTVTILLFLTLCSTLFALGKEHPSQTEIALQDTALTVVDQPPFVEKVVEYETRIWTSPLRMRTKDLLAWGSVVAGTVYLITNDESIYRNIKDYQNEHEWVDRISPHVTRLGEGEITLSIAGLFYLGGLAFKNEKAKETGLLGIQAIIHTGIVAQVLKHLSGRQRPCVEDGEDHWSGPSGFFKRYDPGPFSRYDSFPSGHTIVAWGTATVIAEQYKRTIVVPLVSYSLAAMVGLSRITEGRHWLSDVFVGAALGHAIGRYIVRARSTRVDIHPATDGKNTTFTLRYIF